jgi:hypothetical protein
LDTGKAPGACRKCVDSALQASSPFPSIQGTASPSAC